jgi:hypothetical protein
MEDAASTSKDFLIVEKSEQPLPRLETLEIGDHQTISRGSSPGPTTPVTGLSDEQLFKSRDQSSDQNEDQTANSPLAADDSPPEHLNGFKLYIVVFGLTLAGFLMLLNSSIVVTVRRPLMFPQSKRPPGMSKWSTSGTILRRLLRLGNPPYHE